MNQTSQLYGRRIARNFLNADLFWQNLFFLAFDAKKLKMLGYEELAILLFSFIPFVVYWQLSLIFHLIGADVPTDVAKKYNHKEAKEVFFVCLKLTLQQVAGLVLYFFISNNPWSFSCK